MVKSLVGGRECCALPRTASVLLHERDYIRSYVSTGNEMQRDPFCLPNEFLAHEVKKSCSSLQSSLSGHCSQCSPDEQGERFLPGGNNHQAAGVFSSKKKGEPVSSFLDKRCGQEAIRKGVQRSTLLCCSASGTTENPCSVSARAESPKKVKAK